MKNLNNKDQNLNKGVFLNAPRPVVSQKTNIIAQGVPDGKMWMSTGHSSMNIKEKIQQDQVQQKNMINQVKVGPRKAAGIVPPWDTKNRQQIGRDPPGPSSNTQNSNFQSSQQQPKHYRLLQKPTPTVNKINLKTQESVGKQKQIGMNIDMTDQRSMPLRNHQQVHLLNEENNILQTAPDIPSKQNNRSYLNSNFSPQTLVNGQAQATMITAQTPSSTQQSQPTENTDQTHQTQITQITHITHQTQNSGFLIGSLIPQPLTGFGILGSNFSNGQMLQNSQDQQQLLTSSFRANSLKVGQQCDQEYEQREPGDDEEVQSQRFNGQQSISRDDVMEQNLISSTQFYGKGEQRQGATEGSNLTEKYWTAQAQTSKGQINQGIKNTRPPAGRRVNDSQGTEQVSSQQSRQNDKKGIQKPSSIVQMIRERGISLQSQNQLQNQSLTESVVSCQFNQLHKNPEMRRPPTGYRNNLQNDFKQLDFEDQYNYYDEDSLEEAVNLSGISPDIAPPSQYSKNQGSQIIDHNGSESYFVQFGTMDQQRLMNKRSSSEIQRNQIQQIKKNNNNLVSRQNQNKEIVERVNPQQKQIYPNQKTHQVSNSQPTQNRSQQLSNTMIEGVNGPGGQGNGGAGYIDLSHIVGTGGSLQTHCHEEDEFDEGTTFNDQASQLNLQNSQATVIQRHNILLKNRQGQNSVFQNKNSTSPTHNILGVLETRYVNEEEEEEDIQDDEIEPLDGNDELYPHRTNFNKNLPNFQYERQVQKEVSNSFFVSSSKDTPPVVEGGSQQTSKQDTLYKNQKELLRRPINDFQNLDANRAFTEGIESTGNLNSLKIKLIKPYEKQKGNILNVSSDKLNHINMSNHQIKTEPACQTSYYNYIGGMVPSSAGSQTRAWLDSQNAQNHQIEPNIKQKIGYVRGSQNYQQGIRSGLENSTEIMQNNYVHSFPAQAEEDDESNINSDEQDEYLEDPRHVANSSAANGPTGPVISVGFSSKKQLQRLGDKSSRPIATAQSASFVTGQTSQTMLMRHRQNQPNYFNKELSTNLSQENMRTDLQNKRNLSLRAAGGYNRDFTDQGLHGVSGVSAISGQSELSHINQPQSQYGPRPQTAQGKNTSMFSVLGGPTFQTINISNVSGGNSGLQVGAASSSTSGGLGTHYAARDSRLNQEQNSFQKSMPTRQPNRPTLAQEKSQKLIFGAGHQKPCHSQDLIGIAQKNRGSSQQVDNQNDQVVDPRLNIHSLEDDQQSAAINPLLSQDQLVQHKVQLSSFMSAKTNLNNTVSQGVWQNRGVKIKMKRGVMPISSTPAAIAAENGLIMREKSRGNLSLQTNQTRQATQSQGRIQNNSGRPAISITPNSGQNDNNIPIQRQAQYYNMNSQQQTQGIQNQSKKTEKQKQGYLSAQQQQVSQSFQERVKSTWQTNQSLISNPQKNQQMKQTNGYLWPQTQISHQTNPTQHAEFTEFGVMPEIDDGDLLNVEEDEEELYYYEDSEIARDNYPFNQDQYKNNMQKVQQIKNKPSRVNIKRENRQVKQYQQYDDEDDQVNQQNFAEEDEEDEDLVCSEGNQDEYILPNKQKVQSPRYVRNKKRRQPSQDQRIRKNFNGESYGSQYSQPLEHETFSMQQDTFSKNNKQKASDGPEDPCENEMIRGNPVIVNQNQVNFYKNKKYQIYEPQSVQLRSGQRTGAEYLEAIDRSPIYSRQINQQQIAAEYGNENDIQNQEIDDEDWQLWVDDQNLLQVDQKILHSQTAKKQVNLNQKFSPKNQQALLKQVEISRSNQERVLMSQQLSRQNQLDNMVDFQIMNTMQSQNSRARNYELQLNLMQENIVSQIEQIRQQKKDIKSIKNKLQEEQKLVIQKQKILDEKVKNAEKTKNQVKRQGILNKNEAQKLKSLNSKFTELIQNAKMGLKSQHEFKSINHLQDELSGRLSSIQTLLELLLHDKKSLRSVIDSSDLDSNNDSSSDSNLINYRSSDKKGKSTKTQKRMNDKQSSQQQKKKKHIKDSQSSAEQSPEDESDKSERSIVSIEIQSPKKIQKKDKKIDQQTINLQNVVQSYEVKLQEMSTMMNNLIQLHSNYVPSKNNQLSDHQIRDSQKNIASHIGSETLNNNQKQISLGQIPQNQDLNQKYNEEQILNHKKNESIVSEFVFDPDPNFLLKINENIRTNNVIKPSVIQEIISSGDNLEESNVQNDFHEVVQQHSWTLVGQPSNLFAGVQGTQGDFSVHQPPRQNIQNVFEPKNYHNSEVSQQLRQVINKAGLNTNEISRECTIGGREMAVSGFGDTGTAFQGRTLLSAESSQSKIPSSQMSVFQGLQQKLQTIQNQQTDRALDVGAYGDYNIMGGAAQDYSTYDGGNRVHDVTNNQNDLSDSIASDTYGLTGASASGFGGNQMNTNNKIQYDEELALSGDHEFSINPTMSPGPSIGTNKTHLIQSQVSANHRKEPLVQVQQLIQNINGKSNLDNFEVDYNPQKLSGKATKIISEQIRSQTSRLNFQDSSIKKKIEEDEILRLIHESQEAQEWSESQSFYDSSQTDTFHHRPSGLKQNNDSQVVEIQNDMNSKSPKGKKIKLRVEEEDFLEERRQILNESIVFDEYGQIFDMPKKAVYGIKKAKNLF